MSHHVGNCLLEDLLIDEHSHDFMFWRELIQNAIAEDRVALFAQPVIHIGGGKKLPTEVHGRLINPEGEIVIAEHFMPISNRHQLTPAVDLSILKRLLEYMMTRAGDEEFAINLAVQDIHDYSFMEWLRQTLYANPLVAKRLIFEFAEFGVEHDPKTMAQFVAEIQTMGAQFAIDHFGLHHAAFESLLRLKPRYVKLSPSYSCGLRDHTENQFFIASIGRITHSLDIELIALGIEDVGILTLLQELGVNGYQKYATGELQELK
jgi:EAL domain-containing protein (putative c-di-GMP-specific phosphodiesterase class I)